MVGSGEGTYACGTMRADRCGAYKITEEPSLRALRTILPEILDAVRDRLEDHARRLLTQDDDSTALDRELAALDDQEEALYELLGSNKPTPVMQRRLSAILNRRADLLAQREQWDTQQALDGQLHQVAQQLAAAPEAFFDRKPPEVQGRIYQLLVTNVAIHQTGWGAGRMYDALSGWRLVVNSVSLPTS